MYNLKEVEDDPTYSEEKRQLYRDSNTIEPEPEDSNTE